MRTSQGGGQIDGARERTIDPSDVRLMPGYSIEPVSTGLTFPTSMDFDDEGSLYVVEAGYCYGEVWTKPRLIRINQDGSQTVIATGPENGPWNGVDYHKGNFYVSEGGQADAGRILRISPDGTITPLVENLPSIGDHHTNQLIIKDDYIYFGQGTATNSAVVGVDNASFGWLKRNKEFHDVPCKDVVLSGENYRSQDVFSGNPDKKVLTGAYSPYGVATDAGQRIAGAIPCTGAVMRIPLEGGELELVSWGLRNPFGIAMAEDGKLYVTENAYDERGSRPVWGAGDVLWKLIPDTWYGWPDYSEGRLIRGSDEFKPPAKGDVKRVLQTDPNQPPQPVAIFGVHSSANGLDFSRSDEFGFRGEAFVAQFGDMAPNVGKVLSPVGFKVVRVNVENGVIRDFAVNAGKRNGPATWSKGGGLERPVSVKFSPDGRALYVVDFGVVQMTDKGPAPLQKTGVVWRIFKSKS